MVKTQAPKALKHSSLSTAIAANTEIYIRFMKIDCQLFFADDTHLYTDVNPIHQSQIYSFEICISDMNRWPKVTSKGQKTKPRF